MSYPDFDPASMPSLRVGLRGGAFSMQDDPGADSALAVRFFLEPRKNEKRSKEEGRLIADDVEVIEIRLPGSTDTIRRDVTQTEIDRFPRHYAAFKANDDQDRASGTPLKEWPQMTPAMVLEAQHLGVRTVEALSVVPDANLQKMGYGWLELRKKAQDWLRRAKDGALLSGLREELEERDRRIDAQEKLIQQLNAKIEGVAEGKPIATAPAVDIAALVAQQIALAMAAQKKKPGRPPKAKPAEQA